LFYETTIQNYKINDLDVCKTCKPEFDKTYVLSNQEGVHLDSCQNRHRCERIFY